MHTDFEKMEDGRWKMGSGKRLPFWSAVAVTPLFPCPGCIPKRRGASLPVAVQDLRPDGLWFALPGMVQKSVFIRVNPWLQLSDSYFALRETL